LADGHLVRLITAYKAHFEAIEGGSLTNAQTLERVANELIGHLKARVMKFETKRCDDDYAEAKNALALIETTG
jgi:hypothetical protein